MYFSLAQYNNGNNIDNIDIPLMVLTMVLQRQKQFAKTMNYNSWLH